MAPHNLYLSLPGTSTTRHDYAEHVARQQMMGRQIERPVAERHRLPRIPVPPTKSPQSSPAASPPVDSNGAHGAGPLLRAHPHPRMCVINRGLSERSGRAENRREQPAVLCGLLRPRVGRPAALGGGGREQHDFDQLHLGDHRSAQGGDVYPPGRLPQTPSARSSIRRTPRPAFICGRCRCFIATAGAPRGR